MNLCVHTQGDWYTWNECIIEWLSVLAPSEKKSLPFPVQKIKLVPPNTDLLLVWLSQNP